MGATIASTAPLPRALVGRAPRVAVLESGLADTARRMEAFRRSELEVVRAWTGPVGDAASVVRDRLVLPPELPREIARDLAVRRSSDPVPPVRPWAAELMCAAHLLALARLARTFALRVAVNPEHTVMGAWWDSAEFKVVFTTCAPRSDRHGRLWFYDGDGAAVCAADHFGEAVAKIKRSLA